MAQSINARIARGIDARSAPEKPAHAIALFQHDAPVDQDDAQPLDQMTGFLDRAMIQSSGTPEQRCDVPDGQCERQRDDRIEDDDRPAITQYSRQHGPVYRFVTA